MQCFQYYKEFILEVFSCYCSVIKVLSDSLWSHGVYHTRLSCPSLSPRVCSNSCPLNWWCYLTMLSSATSFSSCSQSSWAPVSFPMSQLFASGGQSIGDSASTSVFPMNSQGCFPLGLTGLIPLLSKEFSRAFSSIPQFKSIRTSALSLLYGPSLTSMHDYWKNHNFDYMDLCWQNDLSLFFFFFNTLSRFVTAFLPRSKWLLISWLQSPFTVILEVRKIKSVTISTLCYLFAMK